MSSEMSLIVGKSELISFIINGVNKQIKNNSGQLPMDIAKYNGDSAIIDSSNKTGVIWSGKKDNANQGL